jgi:hypothetical protein
VTAAPDAVQCPTLDCPVDDEHFRCASGRRLVDPETGCETCQCADGGDDGSSSSEASMAAESSQESQCAQCDEFCRQASGIRDESAACDATSCQCVVVDAAPVADSVSSPPSSPCGEFPTDCVCAAGEIATSSIDENGCDICSCSPVELEAEIKPTLAPAVESVTEDDDTVKPDAVFVVDMAAADDETTSLPLSTSTPAADSRCKTPDCAANCSFGYEIDEKTGCETCECRHLPVADEMSNDYLDVAAGREDALPTAALCHEEAGCDEERCIRALDPQTGCDVCVCDDNGHVEAAEERRTATSSNAVEPNVDGDTGSTTGGEIDQPAISSESTFNTIDSKTDDVYRCLEIGCSYNCESIVDEHGCVVDCRCHGRIISGKDDDNDDDGASVTSYPESPAVGCPEPMCICDRESGYEIVMHVNERGCRVCSCEMRSSTRTSESTDSDETARQPDGEDDGDISFRCPEPMCICDRESGYEIVMHVNERGCRVCSCEMTSSTRVRESTDGDGTAGQSQGEVEEEIIRPVKAEKLYSRAETSPVCDEEQGCTDQHKERKVDDRVDQALADARRGTCLRFSRFCVQFVEMTPPARLIVADSVQVFGFFKEL